MAALLVGIGLVVAPTSAAGPPAPDAGADRGNPFLPYPAIGGVKVAYSTDGGLTWKQRGVVSPPDVVMPWLVSSEARGDGERFQNWIAYSSDAMTEPFAMAPTSPIEQPAEACRAGAQRS